MGAKLVNISKIAQLFKLLSFELFNRFLYFFCIKIEYHKTWKNTRFPPKKVQNGAKVGGAFGQNQHFYILLKICLLDFFDILHKVIDH